jgi:SAM-dependent methyltransferase
VTTFKDHFSAQAEGYRRHRPDYPAGLFHFLAGITPARALAWDCGCGSGQAARGLAPLFARVIATDASPRQVQQVQQVRQVRQVQQVQQVQQVSRAGARAGVRAGTPAGAHAGVRAGALDPNVTLAVCTAEASPLPGGRVDLVTVAQALHWFDPDRFYTEVRRVLKPFGVLAVWTYDLLRVTPEVDRVVDALYHDELAGFWPAERRHVDERYARLPLPAAFDALDPPPAFAMEDQWDLPRLVGFLGTWSATSRYRARRGVDPVEAVLEELERSWGDGTRVRHVRWPFSLRVGICRPRPAGSLY